MRRHKIKTIFKSKFEYAQIGNVKEIKLLDIANFENFAGR